MSGSCVVVGCTVRPKNPNHPLCKRHWHMGKVGGLVWESDARAVERPGAGSGDDELAPCEMVSSTKLGEMFELHATRVNLVLQELGWIERYVKGWKPTDQGLKLGAEERESKQRGVPYVVWPAAITKNAVLLGSVDESLGNAFPVSVADPATADVVESPQGPPSVRWPPEEDDFRTRFPAEYRATDGHQVRSRAEMLIDNWLYMQNIVHAVERRLPIEETAYCDFYIPKNKVYVEFWGMEKHPDYAARMQTKRAIYSRHGFNLVELRDDDISKLDDVLPRYLLKYGIDCS
jgi:hypothetical protein